jgi:PEP-CTERM motif
MGGEHFTATGSSTTIDFINNDLATDNSNGLDNVDLEVSGTAVPEPAMLPLIGFGLAWFALFRRRKAHHLRAAPSSAKGSSLSFTHIRDRN